MLNIYLFLSFLRHLIICFATISCKLLVSREWLLFCFCLCIQMDLLNTTLDTTFLSHVWFRKMINFSNLFLHSFIHFLFFSLFYTNLMIPLNQIQSKVVVSFLFPIFSCEIAWHVLLPPRDSVSIFFDIDIRFPGNLHLDMQYLFILQEKEFFVLVFESCYFIHLDIWCKVEFFCRVSFSLTCDSTLEGTLNLKQIPRKTVVSFSVQIYKFNHS